jgi:hypothetical protein
MKLNLYKLLLYREVRPAPSGTPANPHAQTGASWDYPLLVMAPDWNTAATIGEKFCEEQSTNYLVFKGVWMVRLEKEVLVATE